MKTPVIQISDECQIALDNMGHAAAAAGSVSLSKLIDQQVRVNDVSVRTLPVGELHEVIGAPEKNITSVVMEVHGGVNGTIMLIYPRHSAINVADLLQKKALGSSKVLSEEDDAAIMESGNIVAGAFLSAISNYLDLNMLESVPSMSSDVLKASIDLVLDKFLKKGDGEAIAFEIDYNMGSDSQFVEKVLPQVEISAYFILLLDMKSVKKVLARLDCDNG